MTFLISKVDFEAMKKDIEGIYELYGDYDEAVAGMTTRVVKAGVEEKDGIAVQTVQAITPDESVIW